MYSRLALLSLSSILFFTSGCGLKLGEKPQEEKVVSFTQGDCLGRSTDSLKLFFAGDAKDYEVSEAVQCFQDAFQHFKNNVRGKDQNSYTPDEIAAFIKKKFFKDDGASQFNTGFITEVMAMKAVLIGGSETSITRDELDGISNLLATLKPELVKLNPHMKLIVSKWVPTENAEENVKKYLAAKATMTEVLDKLANLFKAKGKTYELNNLMNLVVEMSRLMKSNSSDTIEKARTLVIKVKTGLIGGEPSLKGNEWNLFLKTLGEAYAQILRLKYFHDTLKPEQVSEKWKVYEAVALDASKLLEELLNEKKSNLLTNQEIIEILAALKPLSDKLNINADLIKQIGEIKVMLLGETLHGINAWSNIDFANLYRKTPALTKNIPLIITNMKYLKADNQALLKKEIKYEDFVQAEAKVVVAVKEISDLVVSGYSITSLRNVLVNLSNTLLKDTLKLPDNFDKLIDLARTAKFTLTGEQGDKLTVANIQLIANVGIRAYSHYVEYTNFASPFKLEDKEFILAADKVILKLSDTLALELKMKANHFISTEELTQLVLKAQEVEFLKTKLTRKALEMTFNTLWSHVLNEPSERLANKPQGGLNSVTLKQLSVELRGWVENLKSIVTSFERNKEYSKADLLEILNKQNGTRTEMQELIRSLAANGLMNYAQSGYLKILTNDGGVYRKIDLVNSNTSRALARIIIRAFANDLTRVEGLKGVTLPEVQAGFEMLKEILYDLELVDPENKVFIDSRFREANLFLSVSNGDDYASYEEIHHLVLHIFSGIKRADSLSELAMKECLVQANKVLIAKTEFSQDCLLNLYYKEQTSFDEMPEFTKAKSQFNEEDNKKYYLSLLKAAGHIESDKKTVLLGDANLFPHVVQYVEMIFSTHDKNRNNILERDEALSAFPIFKNLIALLAKPFTAVKEEDLPGVFVYLLKYTRPPQNLAEKLKFAAFIKDHVCKDDQGKDQPCMKEWNIQSTRLDLGKIFNFIADATKPKPPAVEAAEVITPIAVPTMNPEVPVGQ